MKSCLNCKHAEKTMFEDAKKCTNAKSSYFGKMVYERDLCREGEECKTAK